MKPIFATAAFLAMLATLTCVSALGQPQKLTSTAAAPAPTEEAKPAAAPPAKHRTWLKADARVCLEFPTDMQVVKCSEKYR